MRLKIDEALSQFYLGESLYIDKLETSESRDTKVSLMDSCERLFEIFNTSILLFTAITPFSKTLQSFGYSPLSAWQGRVLYLSPFALRGIELLLSKEQQSKKIQVTSKCYHRVIQVIIALMILRLSQKEGYHHGLGTALGISYIYLVRNDYLTAKQAKIVSCSVIIMRGGIHFLNNQGLGSRMVTMITTAIRLTCCLVMPQVMPALETFLVDLQKAEIRPDDTSFYAQLARDFQKTFPNASLNHNSPSFEEID